MAFSSVQFLFVFLPLALAVYWLCPKRLRNAVPVSYTHLEVYKRQVLWVRRPLSRLATRGRPLSKGGEALRQMEAERTPLYTAAATAELENNATLRCV